MIVVSASMQKAGSGWLYRMTDDLLVANGELSAETIRSRYHLQDNLQGANARVGQLTTRNLLPLLRPALAGHTFAIKTHRPPTAAVRLGLRLGLIQATYVYRDPRAVVVSAYAHGQRIRANGKDHTFAQLQTLDDAITFVGRLLPIWQAWQQLDGVFLTQYEVLLDDALAVLRQLQAYLKTSVPDETLRDIVARYRPDNVSDVRGLHITTASVATTDRREQLSDAQMQRCSEEFGPFLARMGYADDSAESS
jgi:hypothetical protein